MQRQTITVAELAETLGISLPKAYELTNQAGFPLLRIGRKKLIPIAAFEEWLKKSA